MLVKRKPSSDLYTRRPAPPRCGEQWANVSSGGISQVKGFCTIRRYLDLKIANLAATLCMIDADMRYAIPVMADAILQSGAKRHERES